jgi:mono/diheme cytochrome c family protein
VKAQPFLVSALSVLTLLAMGAFAPSSASDSAAGSNASTEALSADDRQCLACHGQEGLSKRFGADTERPLLVDGQAFAGSAHASIGCAGCHGEVDLTKHPGDDRAAAAKFASWREFAQAQARGCRNCHETIADAWATSAHGRAAQGAGPNCSTCHLAHDVSPTAGGTRLREACLDCHQDATAAHETWLPNTKIHFAAVSCAACHSPDAGKNIDLRLFDPVARKVVGTPASPAALTEAGDATTPIDARRLARLLRGLDSEQAPGRLVLRGWIQVSNTADSHRLHERGKALKDCAACHSKDADTFRSVTLSLIGPDGRRARFAAQPDVLHNARSLDSLAGFYAIGGTRIGLMDTLLALALLAGISAPLIHLVLRRVLRAAPPTNEPADPKQTKQP